MLKAFEETEKEIVSSYYWKDTFCRNCNLTKSLAFKKGMRIDEHSCPRCECRELEIQKS